MRPSPNVNTSLSILQRVSMNHYARYSTTFQCCYGIGWKKVSNVFKYNAKVLHKPTFGFFISLRSYPNTIISLSTLQRVSMYLSADYSMTFQCSCGIG